MGLSEDRRDLDEAQREWEQRVLHDLHYWSGVRQPCPCDECRMKRALPMNQKPQVACVTAPQAARHP